LDCFITLISKILISTDDINILKLIKNLKNKKKIIFCSLRPKYLALDSSKAIDVYLYEVNKYNKNFIEKIDEFCVLLPTSPLRSINDLNGAINLFYKKKANSIISMSETFKPPSWNKIINMSSLAVKKNLKVNNKEIANRQITKKFFTPNGAIYVFDYKFLKKNRNYYGPKTYAFIMPKIKSFDIDDIVDFKFVSLIKKNIRILMNAK
jgi:N-acylneuraminate cytidylyltransferase/CMP-N,N'-diacetyllegionaminic acid synthase